MLARASTRTCLGPARLLALGRCPGTLLAAALALGCDERAAGTPEGVPTPPRQASPASPEGRLGAPVHTEHYSILASSFEPCARAHAKTRAPQTQRVGVELRIQRNGAVQVPANAYYATLVAADGDVHEATLGGCGSPLAPALPALGEAASGWVVFDVPRAARGGFTLVYDPELVEVPEREVAIELGR